MERTPQEISEWARRISDHFKKEAKDAKQHGLGDAALVLSAKATSYAFIADRVLDPRPLGLPEDA